MQVINKKNRTLLNEHIINFAHIFITYEHYLLRCCLPIRSRFVSNISGEYI